MTCKRFTCLASLVVALSAVVAADALAGMATPSTILVTPARRKLIELASQLSSIKDIGLVAYDSSATLPEPVLHIWNGSEWIRIEMDDFVSGNFMSGEPRHLILLGDSSTLPARMAADPTWCPDVRRIATLDTANLLNELHKTLKFSASQWRWLAEANGLSLIDHNSERRRYGRWGAPGKEVAVPVPPASGTLSMPPPAVPSESKPAVKATTEEPAAMVPIEAKPAKEEAPAAVKPIEPAADLPAVPPAAEKAPAPVAEKTVAPAQEKPAAQVTPPPAPVVQPPATPAPADK